MPIEDSIPPGDDPLVGLPYRAIRRLGGGGMGEVFLVEHRKLGKLCVAKILHAHLAGDARIADRIRLEAQALGRLNHPNVVSISAAGRTHDERPFIVMEYLQGRTLADELAARGQLPVLEGLGYACQLLHALAATHAIGVIHRDIKPNNLFLCQGPGGIRTLKVVDFGIARVMPGAEPHAPQALAVPTDTGMVVGTPRYISPEGAAGLPVDHRADLYTAALVLYVAIAGCGPFDHVRSGPMLLAAHAAEDPKPPSHFAKEPIPAELDRAILRALRKAPGERFQSADELREELERVMGLLQGSAGWLETSVFDPRSLSNPPRGPFPEDARANSFDAKSPVSASDLAMPIAKDAGRPISSGRVFVIFLTSAVLAAIAVAAIIAAVRGGR